MKSYIFPLFITLLGLFAAYVFYALWHSEEVNPPKALETSKKNIVEDLANKEIIPKSTLTVPEASLETRSQEVDEKEMQEMMGKQEDIPNLTPQQMQVQTQAVYDSLTPEDYEETMEEATVAFEQLDTMVEEQDAKLAEEMQTVEASQEALADEPMEDEAPMEEIPQEEIEMSVPENEEEIDMANEDVNNL